MTREDFEIYTVTANGKTWYKFKVDYIGVYSAPSEEQIKKIREEVKKEVKAKLEWVEEENQKYYARLAAEEENRASLLHEAKELENKIIKMLANPTKNLSTSEKKLRTDVIANMIDLGMSNQEIQLVTQAPMQAIARVRHIKENKIG